MSLDIPNSVTTIGSSAFCECSSLTSVEIPNSVKSISNYAFDACSSLISVKVSWERPLAISDYVFTGVDKSVCSLYVPKGTSSLYKAANGWKDFKKFVEIDPSGIDQIGIWNNGSDLQSIGKDTPVIYNLNGKRISVPTKGLNIINGRKVVMK